MINMILGDCMEYMKTLPDKAYDLAIVDPPYGINIGTSTVVGSRSVTVGGEKLSRPKYTGGLMTRNPQKKNIFKNWEGSQKIK